MENWAVLLFMCSLGKPERSHWTQGKQSKKTLLNFLYGHKKQSASPFLYTQNKVYTCVKQSWRILQQDFVTGFVSSCCSVTHRLWRCEKKMQGLVEISGVFLSCFSQQPENWILTEKGKENKSWRALVSLTVFSDTVHPRPYQQLASTGFWWTPTMKLSSNGI